MMEVEAKAYIDDSKLFRGRASKIGKYTGKEEKIDDYYTLQRGKEYPHKSLRIRERKGFFEINFKRKVSYVKGVHAKRETEFRVSDIKGFLALIKEFGYVKWLTKWKESYIYEINKHFHIEINHVRNLGWFAEVEYLCREKSEIPFARKEVLRIMEKLGIDGKEIVRKGYTKLLWEKMH